MTDSVRLLDGTADDVEPAVALWVAALEARDRMPAAPGTAERAHAKFAAGAIGFPVLKTGDGTLVGFALALDHSSPGYPGDPADVAYLALIAVAPDLQNQGAGGVLLDAAMDAMRASGRKLALLHVLAGGPAERFYARAGWRPDGEPVPHPLTGLPMRRWLVELG